MAGERNQLKFDRLALVVLLLALFVVGCAGAPAYKGDPAGGETAILEQDISPAGRSLLQNSRDQSASGNYVPAAASLERAIRIDPSQPLLWIELGRVRLLEGDYNQAEQVGRKARTLSVGNAAAETQSVQLIADALRGQGRYHDAYLVLAPDD